MTPKVLLYFLTFLLSGHQIVLSSNSTLYRFENKHGTQSNFICSTHSTISERISLIITKLEFLFIRFLSQFFYVCLGWLFICFTIEKVFFGDFRGFLLEGSLSNCCLSNDVKYSRIWKYKWSVIILSLTFCKINQIKSKEFYLKFCGITYIINDRQDKITSAFSQNTWKGSL